MVREEFTGVIFNDLDPCGTRIAYFMIRETTDKIIVYARNTESG